MGLDEALALRAPARDPFALRAVTGSDGRDWYLSMNYWRTGRCLYRWYWDGRYLWIEEVPSVPANVDWAPGHFTPLVSE